MYRRLSETPIPSSAYFSGQKEIKLTSTFHDHERNALRVVKNTFIVTEGSVISIPEQSDSHIAAYALSPSRTRVAVLHEVKDQPGSRRYVEIWKDNALEASLDVTGKHGPFYTDDYLSSLSFSGTEDSILYIAEGNSANDDPLERYRFQPHFGEGFPGRKRPTIYIFSFSLSLAPTLVSLAPRTPVPTLFGQAVFHPQVSNVVYAVGYELAPDLRLPGIKGISNNPNAIWEITVPSIDETGVTAPLDCRVKRLTPPEISCRSPRTLSKDGKHHLFWLACLTHGPFGSTSALYKLDISTPARVEPNTNLTPLLDIVFDPPEGEFPGFYPDHNLASSPFIHILNSPETYIIVHSIWGSRTTIVLISIADGKVKDLMPEGENLYSWKVLNTDGQSQVVCTRSTPTSPPEVLLGHLSSSGEVTWRELHKPKLSPLVSEALSKLRSEVIPIPGRSPVETVLIRPPKNENSAEIPPCLTIVHGGPHSTATTAFTAAHAAFALAGYTVSCPNYSGSLGFGETAVRSLPGRAGSLDVQDCIASVDHLVSLGLAAKGPGKQFVWGGSHGGYLVAHLIGQFPDTFTAGVLRNPVISAGQMGSNDVSVGYYAVFDPERPFLSSPAQPSDTHLKLKKSINPVLTPEIFSRLDKSSALPFVDAVRAAVLLLIGAGDLRVSPKQGMDYYHALKGRHNPPGSVRGEVEMFVFDGQGHPLDGVEAARISWEVGVRFLANSRDGAARLSN